MTLKDPRRFAPTHERSALAGLAAEVAAADAMQRPGRMLELRQALETALALGQVQALDTAFGGAADAHQHRALREALALAVEAPAAREQVVVRAFALPLVLIVAGTAQCRISGVLPDSAALQALFDRHGALGPTRNFGLSNALCSLEHLDGLSPFAVFRTSRALDPQSLHAALPPADIAVEAGRERVHLRFLVGAGIAAADAPSFTETAANIGSWGRECARLIGTQLAAPGVQLLVLPRPPRDVLSAAHAGRRAQLEVALDLFVSNAVRRFRTAVGDPIAILSTHDDHDLRVTLSSPFAEDLVEGFRWPLHPLDDVSGIERHILQLFADVRLTDVRTAPVVLPALRDNGAMLHPRVGEWKALCSCRPAH